MSPINSSSSTSSLPSEVVACFLSSVCLLGVCFVFFCFGVFFNATTGGVGEEEGVARAVLDFLGAEVEAFFFCCRFALVSSVTSSAAVAAVDGGGALCCVFNFLLLVGMASDPESDASHAVPPVTGRLLSPLSFFFLLLLLLVLLLVRPLPQLPSPNDATTTLASAPSSNIKYSDSLGSSWTSSPFGEMDIMINRRHRPFPDSDVEDDRFRFFAVDAGIAFEVTPPSVSSCCDVADFIFIRFPFTTAMCLLGPRPKWTTTGSSPDPSFEPRCCRFCCFAFFRPIPVCPVLLVLPPSTDNTNGSRYSSCICTEVNNSYKKSSTDTSWSRTNRRSLIFSPLLLPIPSPFFPAASAVVVAVVVQSNEIVNRLVDAEPPIPEGIVPGDPPDISIICWL
mmetsp:Transcript_37495/g.91143  ORF Transcript_37495/g.91143 Transcript_37495/m.91143 type:complete len:394 (+) Transcript_37495:1663-2844(+)